MYKHIYRPHPKDERRYCFQFVSSHLDRGGGTPSADEGRGPLPIQIWEGCTPSVKTWEGYPPHQWMGTVFSLSVDTLIGGYPFPGLDKRYPLPRSGQGEGDPHWWMGVHPPPNLGPGREGCAPKWNSIACTWYAADGMPLAFTQEDFLVPTVSVYFY